MKPEGDHGLHAPEYKELTVEMTKHSKLRCSQRGISQEMLELVFQYGVEKFDKHKAMIIYIGRKQVEQYMALGIDLRDAEGIHVITPTNQYGRVVTAYRDRRNIKRYVFTGRPKRHHGLDF
jgi:hypothetical protein